MGYLKRRAETMQQKTWQSEKDYKIVLVPDKLDIFIYGEFNKSFVLMTAFMITAFFANILINGLNIVQNKTNALIRTLTNTQKQVIDRTIEDQCQRVQLLKFSYFHFMT